MIKPTAATLALLAAAAVPVATRADVTFNYALRATVGAEADGDRTLGLGSNGDSTQNLFVNLAPRALIQFGEDWTAYTRIRAFVPTGRAAPFDSNTPDNATARGNSFIALSELWVQYNGLTSYPGEAISLGRQRVRQVGSEWWDEDIDSLRWNFATTLKSFDIGIARQLFHYRSDGAPIIAEQRHRTYGFGNASVDWRPEHRVGARAVVAQDSGSAPRIGDTVDADSKLRNGQLNWLGLYADNGFYDPLNRTPFNYWIEANYLIGKQTEASAGSGNVVDTRNRQDVNAYAGTIAGRWRPFTEFPVAFGAAYTYSSREYQQTGAQSNSSTFSGTQTLINRYNETLRAQLGNLRVASAFVSLSFDNDAISAIFSTLARNDGNAAITADNVIAQTQANGRNHVGNGVDLVATHYFGRALRRQRLLDSGDAFVSQKRRSLISIRASAFDPGAAFGPGTELDYRVLLEATLWVN